MRLAAEREYRGHTLLLFESRITEGGVPTERHWIVIAPDGINIIGAPKETESDARALVDSLIRSNAEPGEPSARETGEAQPNQDANG